MMPDTLAKIIANKKEEIAARRRLRSLADLDRSATEAPRGFEAALRAKAAGGQAGLIAEIKKASPSKGSIRADFDPAAHARAYEAGGASCLSVLTDARFFGGCEEDLVAARTASRLPVLRKDFIVDPWQVAETRAIGADAVLIIVAALEDSLMREIEAAAFERGLDVLVEVHDEAELDRALTRLNARLIGVNNRDLRTFETSIAVTARLARHMPADALFVSESGISDPSDCRLLAMLGVHAFLVGESLMRQADIAAAAARLVGGFAARPHQTDTAAPPGA